jgi:hypothetical protein
MHPSRSDDDRGLTSFVNHTWVRSGWTGHWERPNFCIGDRVLAMKDRHIPFVKRNQAGEVIAAYAEAQPDAGEYLAPDSAELSPLVSAASAEAGTVQAMTESDLDLVRVLEDLVNALLHKNVIQPTYLPEEARAKILQRQRMRGELDELTGLLVEDEPTF